MSMTEEGMNRLIDEIMSQGYDEKTAAHYAALIGDTPLTDADSNIVVKENGREIARLRPLKFFDG